MGRLPVRPVTKRDLSRVGFPQRLVSDFGLTPREVGFTPNGEETSVSSTGFPKDWLLNGTRKGTAQSPRGNSDDDFGQRQRNWLSGQRRVSPKIGGAAKAMARHRDGNLDDFGLRERHGRQAVYSASETGLSGLA